MKIIIIALIIFTHFDFLLYADENICKKFDIKCKSKKFIDETKDYQKKEWADGKKQIIETKNKMIKGILKKN